jgi:hypothetical protein
MKTTPGTPFPPFFVASVAIWSIPLILYNTQTIVIDPDELEVSGNKGT